MEWTKELKELFDDPLLADVRPMVVAPTFSDRKDKQVAELDAWIAEHGREPQRNGDLTEKRMWARLTALRKQS
ncbi:MAG: hypothetical protein MR919_07865 [Parabacteroides sp.]|nr:hypothetical protein [Parabacteroides sp.]